MKTVQQKEFVLANESGNEISKTDNLVLVINNNITKIPLRDFFNGYTQGTDEIIGWSLFSDMQIVDNLIRFSEEIDIHILNKNTEEHLFIKKIKNPFLQLNDKEIDDESMNAMIEGEWSRIKEEIRKASEDETITEETIPGTLTEPEPVDEEEAEEEQSKEESEEDSTIIEGCESYEDDKTELIDEGYEELENENWRLLYKQDGKPPMILVLFADEAKYNRIKVLESNIQPDRIEVTIKGPEGKENVVIVFNRGEKQD